MASLLHMALEGQLGGIFGQVDMSAGADNHSGEPAGSGPQASEGSPEREMLTLKGPLAVQFSQALAALYNKRADDHQGDAQEEGAQSTSPDSAAFESQANDALAFQELADNIRIMSEDESADSSTTIYGVDAKDVKPEDIVEVSQSFDSENPEEFVVVMNDDYPSENGEGGGENATRELTPIGKALESLCQEKGIPLFYSFEAYALSCTEKDTFAMEGILFKDDAQKLTDMKLKRISNNLTDMVTRIANALEAAIKKGWTVKLSGSNDDYKIVISAVDEKTGKRLHATASVN